MIASLQSLYHWIMASPTRRTWAWASSRSWWWTGKPGVLQCRVRHDWATEQNWTEEIIYISHTIGFPNTCFFFSLQYLHVLRVRLVQKTTNKSPTASLTSSYRIFFPSCSRTPPHKYASTSAAAGLLYILKGSYKRKKKKLRLSEAQSGNPSFRSEVQGWIGFRGDLSTDNQQETELSRFRGASGWQ